MIDARVDIELGEPLVDVLSPALAPFLQKVGTIPVAVLLAEPVFADLPQRQHHIRVRLGLAIGTDVPMDIEVGDHATIDELTPNKLSREVNTPFWG